MRFPRQRKMQKQRGAVLFVVLMILVALTIITLLATNIGKMDIKISNAYVKQSESFIKGEEMFARLRYALEQVPLPEGIATTGDANKTNRPIWITPNLANDANPVGATTGEPDFTNPNFASNSTNPLQGWSKEKTLTCTDIANWMKQYAGLQNAVRGRGKEERFEPLDCEHIDPEGKTRTVIELVNRKQNEGDIDELRDTYYYRITINARTEGEDKDKNVGQTLIQGVTGIQYN